MAAKPEFGLGLVSLGRLSGFRPSPLPSREKAHELLAIAVEQGVCTFDTAPAYGTSEQLTGAFFREMAPSARRRLILATKCGEHWDAAAQSTFVDHSYDALVRSIDRSLERLGTIDILQIHKTTVEVLRGSRVWKALDYARSCGIRTIGASVSDVETGRLALESGAVEVIQMPFNMHFRALEAILHEAAKRNRRVWTNRPFAMGQLIHDDKVSKIEAYRFIVALGFDGVVLTGTSRSDHLRDDLEAFGEALKRTADISHEGSP
jgi:aryl-alcohol dehydrogenase-like predicted oxidoreductase